MVLDYFEILKTILGAIMVIYIYIWMLPCIISGVVLSHGDIQRIVWIDKQLAKDVDKLHSNCQYMMSYSIMSRFMNYCVAYPFIRHRETTISWKFKFFMWFHSIGWWLFFIFLASNFLF